MGLMVEQDSAAQIIVIKIDQMREKVNENVNKSCFENWRIEIKHMIVGESLEGAYQDFDGTNLR